MDEQHAAADGGANGAEATNEQKQEEPQQQPMSKNQQKKLRKQQRQEEQKRLRREQEKQAKLAKQEQRRAEGQERMAAMTEEEKAAWRAERQAKVEARRQEVGAKKARLQKALEEGQRVVIDLGFEDKMSESEIKSLCQQLGYAYGENSRAAAPCHLILTSVAGRMKEHIAKQLSGFDHWVVTRTEADYLQHFEGAADQLVYLTADSPHEIAELDPGKAYIIGGLVDRNRHKGICFRKAEAQGIATARLPIGEYMKLASSQVMTTNHVVEIMLRWLELRDWEAAFNAVVPARKRKHEEEEEQGDQGAKEGQGLGKRQQTREGQQPLEASSNQNQQQQEAQAQQQEQQAEEAAAAADAGACATATEAGKADAAAAPGGS